jgi:hypothetical protein
MKVNGNYLKQLYNDKGESEVTFSLSNYRHQQQIKSLDKETLYSIEIKKARSKKSLQQNSYLWAMIHKLELHTGEDGMDIYCKALVEANAKFFYIASIPEAYEELLSAHRAVMKYGKVEIVNENGNSTPGIRYKVFYGSSKFDKEEENKLLEVVSRWCIEENIL